MNRIETKIIIMVTNRLAAAGDCDAKTEMIEELSENLYQRYIELEKSGMTEEEALAQAMGSLGDVDELLAYLKETEAAETGGNAAGCTDKDRSADTEEQGSDYGDFGHDSAGDPYGEKGHSHFRDGWESSISGIVNSALSKAKEAVDMAVDAAKDVSGQIKEKYPDGVFNQFNTQKNREIISTVVAAETLHSLDIRMINGDVDIRKNESGSDQVEIETDIEEVEIMVRDDGVLSVSQTSTASATFFFMRGIRSLKVTVWLPEKAWRRFNISTVSGDIYINRMISSDYAELSTTSGDVNIGVMAADEMMIHTVSGDICGRGMNGGMLTGSSKSGDIDICGHLQRCEFTSASGDIDFSGTVTDCKCASSSGDVDLDFEALPGKLDASSSSGDCDVEVPTDRGFSLSYRTVSGEFTTDLVLTGTMQRKRGDVIFGEGIEGELKITSASGDISLYAK